MHRDFYKLGAEPFRLTPDPAFVLAHQSYLTAQTRMRHALEQGDGILVVTGGPGTGKTALIANFLSRLPPDRVLTANIDACAEAAELDEGDVMVSWLPLYHDMGLVGFLAIPMTAGVPLVQAAPQDFMAHPGNWMRWISDWGPSFCTFPFSTSS